MSSGETTGPESGGPALSGREAVTAIAHLYRGEMKRSLVWRTRLDTTTNWAIVSTLALLTFSFNNPEYSSETLIVGMYANMVFLLIEARRFRFFDVWRARVRMIEENFYGPLLRRDGSSPDAHWAVHVADDLLRPKFKITMMQAVKARLMRNFVFVFVFLLAAWVGRVLVIPVPESHSLTGIFSIGGLPGWVPMTLVAVLYGFLLLVIFLTPKAEPPEVSYWPDPRHKGKDVPSLDA
jgi:uncharacterized membrane protein